MYLSFDVLSVGQDCTSHIQHLTEGFGELVVRVVFGVDGEVVFQQRGPSDLSKLLAPLAPFTMT